ncbi:porin family protein [Gilvimarinus sp. SDUM040013]|uniref:Porin family protein n=1 Tax=Gilvimarinus gilvus TaxID=3058038 RepID=A0ABU4S2T0_9GAMM|nr:porin family protein [Gilvimarinus sp. SDUM040013]MDO3387577.1 porin family protein [Gilvimarinus sp. SDUM040013]MDX6850158.1 porin family protein [Gilvimarinus sp. SDUM040013]
MKLTKSISALLLPAALLTSGAALADNNRGFFAGVGASAINVDDSASFDKANLWTAEIFGGYKLNPWLGAEVRYGTGLGEEELYLDYAGLSTTKMDIDNSVSIYYRAEAVNQTGRFYALLGYSDVEFTVLGNGASATLSEDDFSWGLGAGFIVAPKLSLNFEYRNLVDVDAYRFTTITTSLDYRF